MKAFCQGRSTGKQWDVDSKWVFLKKGKENDSWPYFKLYKCVKVI